MASPLANEHDEQNNMVNSAYVDDWDSWISDHYSLLTIIVKHGVLFRELALLREALLRGALLICVGVYNWTAER